jgi:glycerol-3-phosphate acyltransferase PlsX
MGGDAGPAAILAGAAIARRRHPKVRFLLHGDEGILKPLLERHRALAKSAEIRHAPGVIHMSEKPSQAVRRGRNSSMWHAVEAVAKQEANVAVSAGNTGALMAISMLRLGVIEGIQRPAIAVIWPTMRGQSIVLDVGANAGCDAEQLVDFAVMGEAFARSISARKRSRASNPSSAPRRSSAPRICRSNSTASSRATASVRESSTSSSPTALPATSP